MKKRLMNNFGLKILAFCIAALLWFVVVNVDDPISQKTFLDIPVSVINTEVLAETQQTFHIVDDTQTVDVTVSAKRSVINRISANDISAIADMKELTLKTQIPIDITIEGYKYESAVAHPRNLQVKLEDELTKKFPIIPTTVGTVRDGYALGEIEAVPEKVSIRGPRSVIERISRVEATVSVSGLSEDTVLPSELVLYDEEDETIDQELLTNNIGADGVGVSIQLLRTKDIPISFDTSEIKTADGYSFDGITFEPTTIQVSGTKEDMNALTKIMVPASVLKTEYLKVRTEKVVDISEYLPEGIQLVDENAGSIVVTINVQKDGTNTFDITVASITVNNLASDLALDYVTAEAIEIQVRGPKTLLEDLDINSKVSIDLGKYLEPGEYTVPIVVNLPAGCELEKEAVVNIRLREKEQE